MFGTDTVDDKIDPTKPVDGLLDSGLNLSRIPDICLDTQAGISGSCGKFLDCVLIRRSSLESVACRNCRVPTNWKTLLSTDDGSTGTMSHLINDVNRESRPR